MNEIFTINLTESEVIALQQVLGFVLHHQNDDLFSVALKLDAIHSPDDVDYDSVVFYKNDESGAPYKKYKHRDFSIGFK